MSWDEVIYRGWGAQFAEAVGPPIQPDLSRYNVIDSIHGELYRFNHNTIYYYLDDEFYKLGRFIGTKMKSSSTFYLFKTINGTVVGIYVKDNGLFYQRK